MLLYMIAILVLIAFISRLIICFNSFGWFSRGFAGDSSVHIQIIKQLKQGWRNKRIDNYIIPNEMSYPILFHRFCSFFPTYILEKISFIPNLLIFVLSYFAFTCFTVYQFNQFFPEANYSVLFMGLVCHIIAIQNLVTAGPAIAYVKLSSRLLAKISCSFYILFSFFYLEFNDDLSFYLAVLSAALAFLSGTFAAQVLIFFTIIFSLLTLELGLLTLTFTGLIMSIVLSFGYSLRSIVAMMKYWRIYFLRVKKSRYTAPVLSSYLNLIEVIKNLSSGRIKSVCKQLYKKEPSRALLHYPEMFVVFFLLFSTDSSLAYLDDIYLSVILIYCITSLSALNFLGESYRYLEYGLFFLNPCVLSLFLFTHYGLAHSTYFFLFYAAYSFFISIFINRLGGHSHKAGEDILSSFLEKLGVSNTHTVFPVSMRLGADVVARTNCRSFWWQPGGVTDLKMYDEYIHEYPYLSLDWRKLCKRHKVDFIIIDKQAQGKFADNYEFESLEVILDDQFYSAYRYV